MRVVGKKERGEKSLTKREGGVAELGSDDLENHRLRVNHSGQYGLRGR